MSDQQLCNLNHLLLAKCSSNNELALTVWVSAGYNTFHGVKTVSLSVTVAICSKHVMI